MDVLQENAEAVSQPTRARLLTELSEMRRPAGTAELAERLGLHPNGVRQHLEILRKAGLVDRERENQGRGRPRDVWSIGADADPGGHAPTGYSELSRWLVQAFGRGAGDPKAMVERGREIGRNLPADGGHVSAETAFRGALAAMGFKPERLDTPPGRATYCLTNCPYRDAVIEDQAMICGLHKGITQGILESVDPESRMTGFVAKDPDKVGCLITVEGPLAEKQPPGSADG
jgi:predicted ArsR family transcriptional regulator